MSSLAIFHISIEFWGIIFCLLATNYVFMSLIAIQELHNIR